MTPAEVGDVLRVLAETAGRMAAFSEGLDERELQQRPAAKAWSAVEILAHLRACADVWGDTIQAMLADDNPSLAHRSPRDWLKQTDYRRMPYGDSLAAFAAQRRQLLAVLNGLAMEDWSRGALIRGRQHTIFSQARRMAHHEVIHCQQLEELGRWPGRKPATT